MKLLATFLVATCLLGSYQVKPVIAQSYQQQAWTYEEVNQTGQVRLDFTVHFEDGSSFSFSRPNAIHVVSRVYSGSTQVGWICRAHQRNFFTAVGNVQL